METLNFYTEGFFPSYAHPDDSGFDLYARTEVYIPGLLSLISPETFYTKDTKYWALVPTGLFVDIPEGYEIQVRSKSGRALKEGLFVLNSPGTIDAGYENEIGVVLCNMGHSVVIKKGEKIAQGVLAEVAKADLQLVPKDILFAGSDSSRKDGGFGSTGI